MSSSAPILVAGGGPAGSTVATLLAQRGYSVSLFEQAKFPRDHIGESLLPATLATLELSGALDAVRKAGFVEKAGATMVWGKDADPWTWYFRETNSRFPVAYQVNRPEFDHLLLQHAAEEGVQVHEQTRVEDVIFDAGRAIGVRIRDNLIEGSFVVDATGQSCLINSKFHTRNWDEDFVNLAIYNYFSGANHLEGEDRGNILIESVPIGWLWKIPLRNDVSSVGLVADRDSTVEAIRKTSIEEVFVTALDESKIVRGLLSGSNSNSDPIVTRDWSYQSAKFAGCGWVSVGDAACFIDPLFSTGVHLAVSGAFLAAALVDTALSDQRIATEATQAYEGLYRQQYEHFRELTSLFYSGNRTVDSYFWESRRIANQENYAPREAFIRTVSGQNVAGYERSVLHHAATPDKFRQALREFDDGLKHRRDELSNTSLFESRVVCASGVRVASSVVLDGMRFSRGKVIRGRDRIDLAVSDFVAEVVLSCQRPRTVSSIVQQMTATSHPSTIAEKVTSTVSLLVIDGILELVESSSSN